MSHRRSTKIVATLGPSSSTPDRIAQLAEAGVDVFRLNFSHGSHDDHRQRFEAIRALEVKRRQPIGILLDLQGPKLRIGAFEKGRIALAEGDRFRFDMAASPGTQARVTLPHREVYAALHPGIEILLDDGKMRLRIESCGDDFAEAIALTAGTLSDRKGLNLPGAVLPLSALSVKDRADLAFGLELGTDWIALSFVQRPEDVLEARALIGKRAGIVSKIEKPAALNALEAIVELSDAVMVARGDLGVELAPELVPVQQKRIIQQCRSRGRPVIVATQMLKSMIEAPTPTRAEASDVATAVYDGADAVMLSAESAAGRYPIEAVTMMRRIITEVERDPLHAHTLAASRAALEETSADAITAAAAQVASTVKAVAIAAFTSSGATTLRAARERPSVPILGLTANLQTSRRLALAWGVHPVHTKDIDNFNDMVVRACHIAIQENLAVPGEKIVITAGVPFGHAGSTNILRLALIEPHHAGPDPGLAE